MKKREKKRIAPNEASLIRWIITLAVSFPIGMLLLIPIAPFFMDRVEITPNFTMISEYSFMGISFGGLLTELVFIALFCGMVLAKRFAYLVEREVGCCSCEVRCNLSCKGKRSSTAV